MLNKKDYKRVFGFFPSQYYYIFRKWNKVEIRFIKEEYGYRLARLHRKTKCYSRSSERDSLYQCVMI